MPLPFLSDYCWTIYNNWDDVLLDYIDQINQSDAEEEHEDALARLRALIINADKDAGIGKLRFKIWGEEESTIIDLTGLTNKQVVNALAEYVSHLPDDAVGDHRFVECISEEGNFWVISWGS